jgi:hypothetical protein
MGAGLCAVVGAPSLRRIADIPFAAGVAALERWQLTAREGQLRLSRSAVRGPAEHDRHFGTCRIEARLARGPLRPLVGMRLDISHWSAAATAVELIPCQRVRPSTAYLRVGRALLDSLTCSVATHPPVPRRADVTPRQPAADQAEPRTAMSGGQLPDLLRSQSVRRSHEPYPPSFGPPGQPPWPG